MDAMKIGIGRQSVIFAKSKDAERIKRQNRRASLSSKEARKVRKQLQNMDNESYEEDEGLLYGLGSLIKTFKIVAWRLHAASVPTAPSHGHCRAVILNLKIIKKIFSCT